MDRFSQFFLTPLFTKSATEREINARDPGQFCWLGPTWFGGCRVSGLLYLQGLAWKLAGTIPAFCTGVGALGPLEFESQGVHCLCIFGCLGISGASV